MQELDVRFGPARRRTCKVRVGAGALDALLEDLASTLPGRRLFVVSDDRVAPLYGEPLCRNLVRRGQPAELLTFPEGERNKTREIKARLEDRLLDAGAGRDSAVIAVGGGVTGDLAGFLAATWHRGIPVVQVPTSLLAMADAALGGKTAINLGAGKNLVGAFHQPLAVYADVSVLSTLDEERYVEGFAEVIKSAAVGDVRLFRWLERNVDALLDRDTQALEHAISACMTIKGRVVSRDERETGRRAVLNFGHTIGHALEALSGYEMHHGHAVAVGMGVEGRIAVGETGFPSSHLERLVRLVERFGLPLRPPASAAPSAVAEAARRDKKARAGEVRYALPREIGRMLPGAEVTVPVDESAAISALTGAAG
jgi:3-dehydroquinate synthase